MKKTLAAHLTFCALAVAPTWLGAQTTIINEDFEGISYVSGQPLPNVGSLVWESITVSDNGDINIESWAGPAGGGGNCLDILDTASTGVPNGDCGIKETNAISSANGGAGIDKGTLELDLRYLDPAADQWFGFQMFDADQSAENDWDNAIFQVHFRASNTVRLRGGDASSSTNVVVNLLPADWDVTKAYHFVVHWDVTGRKLDCQVYDAADLSTPIADTLTTNPDLSVRGGPTTGGPAASLTIKGGNADTPHFQIDNLTVTDDSGAGATPTPTPSPPPSGVGVWTQY
jgi:hypothetical protein